VPAPGVAEACVEHSFVDGVRQEGKDESEAACPATYVPVDPPLPQLLQQRLRVDQVAGVEAFGEPAVDRGEEVAGFGALALIAPEAGEARRGAQLQGSRTLLAGARTPSIAASPARSARSASSSCACG